MSALTPRGSTRSWRRLRALVLDRDAHRCQVPLDGGSLCGAWATHVDHIIPRRDGGTDQLVNLRAACRTCNLRRGARPDNVPRSARRGMGWSW